MFLWLKFTVSSSSLWKWLVVSRSRVRSVWPGPGLPSPHFTSRSMRPRLRRRCVMPRCSPRPRTLSSPGSPHLSDSRPRRRGGAAAVARLAAGGWLGPEPHGAALSFATLGPAAADTRQSQATSLRGQRRTTATAARGRKMQRWIIVEQIQGNIHDFSRWVVKLTLQNMRDRYGTPKNIFSWLKNISDSA